MNTVLNTPEEKLRAKIDEMKEALSQEGAPNFRNFWDARVSCIELFKEQLAASVRSLLWEEYIELTTEGKRLKEVLDTQSSFAVEQIELAIKQLEEEIAAGPRSTAEKLACPKCLQHNAQFYQEASIKLSFFSLYGAKIQELRKELVNTEMRVRQKNQFFSRLSSLGDQIFPPRKEMIEQLSSAFLSDVEKFASTRFSNLTEKKRAVIYDLREEIKALQQLAKTLCVNSKTFTTVRQKLSTSWDQLREIEKEQRKEFLEHKTLSSETAKALHEEIAAFTHDQGVARLDEIAQKMRAAKLVRSDALRLKEALEKVKEPLEAAKKEEGEKKRQAALVQEEARKAAVQEFCTSIEAAATFEQLDERYAKIASLSLNRIERQEIEQKVRSIRDSLQAKQLASLSDSDRASLDKLQTLLEERRARRGEIKAKIEEYRKIRGGSELDFEQAIKTNELLEGEKARLEEVDEAIRQIQDKIAACVEQQ